MKKYTAIMTAFEEFMNTIRAEYAKNIAESNQQAEEARGLIARIQHTIAKHEELQSITRAIGEQMATTAIGMDAATSNIKSALNDLYDGAVPECAVEEFVGYCDQCGDELTITNEGVKVEDAVLCAECASQVEEVAEA